MVASEPKLWPYVWKPMLWSLVIFLAVLISGGFVVVPWAESLAKSWGVAEFVGGAVGVVLYVVFWWFAAGIVYLGIAGLLSSVLWDRLSLEVEELVGSPPSGKGPGCLAAFLDTLYRLPFTVVIVFLSVVLGWACFGLVGVLLAGFLSLFDLTACAYFRRGVLFPGQWSRVFKAREWTGFALCCGVVSVIPFINVLLLPSMVAGGTLLCRDAESKNGAKP